MPVGAYPEIHPDCAELSGGIDDNAAEEPIVEPLATAMRGDSPTARRLAGWNRRGAPAVQGVADGVEAP